MLFMCHLWDIHNVQKTSQRRLKPSCDHRVYLSLSFNIGLILGFYGLLRCDSFKFTLRKDFKDFTKLVLNFKNSDVHEKTLFFYDHISKIARIAQSVKRSPCDERLQFWNPAISNSIYEKHRFVKLMFSVSSEI